MKVKVKIYDCNWETYKEIYLDAIKLAYKKDGKELDSKEVFVEIENLEGETVQAKRSPRGKHSRTISVYEDNSLKYIIGFSNTGYDKDKQKEVENIGGKYIYGNSDFHSNTYICQGINKIIEYYYDSKNNYPEAKLFFYLLDTKTKSYPHSLSNLINYRKLATIGFEILNLNEISFENFEELGFSENESHDSIKYISFNKFANDILHLSKKNSGNIPSYLKCVDYDYDINNEIDEVETSSYKESTNEKYIYTFKTLGAEAYDSFLTMWTLQTLAEQENKKLEFLFSSEFHNFRDNQEDIRITENFPKPIIDLFVKIGLDIKYEDSDEILQQFEREKTQYNDAKAKGILRNQELFKNNMRAKGLETKCHLCNCEIEDILEASHLWGIADIKKASSDEIKKVVNLESMKGILGNNASYKNELFYKKYMLANSGDNGIWLCSNHHGLFDNHYFCFDSEDGKILLDITDDEEALEYIKEISKYDSLPKDVLTPKTKVFLKKREELFNVSKKLSKD